MQISLWKRVTLFFMLVCFSLLSAAEIVITNSTPQTAQELVDQGYDVIGKFDDGVRLIASQSEIKALEKSYTIEIRESDDVLRARIREAMGKDGRNLSVYPSYDEYVQQIKELETSYPNLCKVTEVGVSRGMEYYEAGKAAYNQYNHAIWLIKVSDNVTEDEDEPGYMVLGEHHAREPSSLYVSMYVLRWLLENYGTDDVATSFVDNKQIWFMPLVNPNGYTVIYEEDNSMMRKNIRDNQNNSKVDITEWNPAGNTQDGVDLNRNYDASWGTSGVSHNSGQSTYCGPKALSEPETQTVARVMDSLPHVLAEMSYHSYSQVILYSPAHSASATIPNKDALWELGANIANKIKKTNAPSQSYGHGTPAAAIGYSASGGLMDYAYLKLGIFGYCGELGTKFVQTTGLEQRAANNLEGLKEMFWRDEYATVTGHAKHNISNTPIPGRIIVSSVDVNSSTDPHYRSCESFGRYYRFLSPGSYTLTFVPDVDSLKEKTISGVEVSYDSITTVDFVYPQEVSNLKEMQAKSGFSVSQLSNRNLLITSPQNAISKVSLVSLQGRTISTQQFEDKTYKASISLPNSGAGLYLLKIVTPKGVLTEKIKM